MSIDWPDCPALVEGRVAGCKFCIWQPGGPSDLCLEKLEDYEEKVKPRNKRLKLRLRLKDEDGS
jgi:hypothetical protein